MKARSIWFLALAVIAGGSAAAEQASAVFSEVNGKVEYKEPGGDWKTARVGLSVLPGDVVSTGFKSTAVLMIGHTSISVKAITRLTLEQLIKTSGGTSTTLFLLSGRVKADVPPQPGQTTAFQITSPTATASVRGTAFEFDGVNLIVDRGSVQLATPTMQFRHVDAGQFSMVTPGGVVPPAVAVSVEHGLDSVHELVTQQQEASLTPPPTVTPLAPPTTNVPNFVVTVN